MSNKNKKNNNQKQIGEKTLKLQDLKDFTVGEIVEQSKRVDQENQDNESVLDKYIRQHRSEIEEAKSKNLDEFIQNEREKLSPSEEKEESEEKNVTDELTENPVSTDKEELLSHDNHEEEKAEVVKSEQENISDENNDAKEESDVEKNEPTLDPVIMADAAQIADEKSKMTVAPTDSAESFADEKLSVKESSEGVLEQQVSQEPVPIIMSANEVPLTEKVVSTDKTEENIKAQAEISENPVIAPSDKNQEVLSRSKGKNRKTPIIIGVCAVVLLGVGAVGFAQYNANQHPKPVQTAKSNSESSDLDKFNKAYDAFFTDKSHVALKNNQFTQFSTLEKMVSPHKNATAWSNAVSETQDLKEQIAAINLVNALFTKPVITDGKFDTTPKVINNVKIPATPKTGNETLNKLLTRAIALAKSQVEKNATTTSSTQKASAGTTSSSDNTQGNTTPSTNTTESNTNTDTNNSGSSSVVTNNGGLSANGVTLDTAKARVQPQAGINPNDSAFIWGDGILQKVLDICRARGYIKGNNYILVPTAIHTTNGSQGFPAGIVSGYYNLYAPDGSYLVSINDKTGYFVGNGAGHADDLDY
ncbi:MAG: cell division site-positioning protein MapZ family protein [Streptococcaceae bacterium]|nr:cell division site-positioning protein MapZ family protein [Streptococcaceae bacterium]